LINNLSSPIESLDLIIIRRIIIYFTNIVYSIANVKYFLK